MIDNILDFLSFENVFYYYSMEIDTLTVVQEILSDKSACDFTRNNARRIAGEIIQEVKAQGVRDDLRRQLPGLPVFEGVTSQEVVELFFNRLDQLNSREEKMFLLHLLCFCLSCDKIDIEGLEDVSVLKNRFNQYYSEFRDKVEFTEDFLKNQIRQSIVSYDGKQIKEDEFISAVYRDKVSNLSDIFDYSLERFVCIAAAFVYKDGGLASTPEQAVAVCKNNLQDLIPMHKAMEEGRSNSSDDDFAILFLTIVIVGVVVAIIYESETILAIAVIAAIIVFVFGVTFSGLSIAEISYRQYLENRNALNDFDSSEEDEEEDEEEVYA